jgi:hypothetical protein
MAFMDTLRNIFVPKFAQHKTVKSTGAELQKATADAERISRTELSPMFDDLPLTLMWADMLKSISRMTPSHYELARHSYKIGHLDPRVENSYTVLKDKAVEPNESGRPFEIGLDAEFQEEWWERLNMLAESLHLYSIPNEATEYGTLEGECYYHALINTKRRPFEVYALEKIPGPTDGFEMRGPRFFDPNLDGKYLLLEVDTNKVVKVYNGFEVIPFKRNARETAVGKPLLGSTIRLYPYLEKMENVLPIMRQYRTGAARIFKYPEMSPEQFRNMADEQKRLEREKGDKKPFSDVHTTAEVKLQDATSSALYNIDDIEYMLLSCLAAVGTPLFLLASMPDRVPNRAVSDTIYDNWIRGPVHGVEAMLAGNLPALRWMGDAALDGMGILKVLGLQLYLWNANPREMGLKIEFPNKLPLTAVEVDATQKMYEGEVLSKTGFARRMGSIDYEAELEQMATDEELKLELLGEPEPPDVSTDGNGQDGELVDDEMQDVIESAKSMIKFAKGNGVLS